MAFDLSAIAGVLKGSSDLLIASKALVGDRQDSLIDRLAAHIRSIEAWSDQIQFLGMAKSLSSDSTVPLSINDSPRRFRPTGSKGSSLSEQDIVNQRCSFLILGDPGSGKTTIVKRLIRMILLKEPERGAAECNFPMLVVAREMKEGSSIVRVIADELGLQYGYREFAPRSKQSLISSGELLKQGGYYYGEEQLDYVINNFLNDSKVTLFVDGIDELSTEMRLAVESELEWLARGNGLKIIVTCRSGDYGRRQIEGLDVVEIAPLGASQIIDLANKWCTSAAEFLAALDAAPYRDAADKPLFLTQLIQVYNAFSYLPPRPADVYQKIVRLLLDSWDRERRIFRKSEYAGFDNDRKLEFLSALSFELTYHIKAKRFSAEQLQSAYRVIAPKFGLPPHEAEDVCAEIESHTGLVVKTYDLFEFSHLSLQEYLCAYHMVRLPFQPIMAEYLVQYPAPVAVGVSISAEPGLWFASLIYYAREAGMREHKMSYRYVTSELSAWSLIGRLIIESPIFTPSSWLGAAILEVLSVLTSEPWEQASGGVNVVAFLKLKGVVESIRMALEHYYFDLDKNLKLEAGTKLLVLEWVAGQNERHSPRMPWRLTMPSALVRTLDREFEIRYLCLSAEGTLIGQRLEL